MPLWAEQSNLWTDASEQWLGGGMSVPTGPLGEAVDALRALIANTPFFQTWTGTAMASDALFRVFTGEDGWPIVAASIAGGVLTITTRDQHEVNVEDVITIAGASLGAESILNVAGSQTVTAVTSDTISMSTELDDVEEFYIVDAFVLPATRPIAIVCEEDNSLASTSIGTGGCSIVNGSLDILLEADVSAFGQQKRKNAMGEARNAVGQFLRDLMETQGTGDLMFLNTAHLTVGPSFTDRGEQDDSVKRFERWNALIHVTWGLEG